MQSADCRRAVERGSVQQRHFGFTELAPHWIGTTCAHSYRVEEVELKARLTIALLMISMLPISAVAEGKRSAQTAKSVIARSSRQQPSSTASRPAQTQVPPESRDAKADPQHSSDNGQQTIVVDVWSSAEEADPVKLSSGFAASALNAAYRMQSAGRRLEEVIRKSYPLSEYLIQVDLDSIDESLRLATVSATNDADRRALQQLESQNHRFRLLSDWLIEQNRNLGLANYYMSASALDRDERFQTAVACNKFLVSMLASGRLSEDNSCR